MHISIALETILMLPYTLHEVHINQKNLLRMDGVSFQNNHLELYLNRNLCKYFSQGMCKKENLCPFRHDYSPSGSKVIIGNIPLVPSSMQKVCSFYQLGHCVRGLQCKFEHSTTSSADSYSFKMQSDIQPCKYFSSTGYCQRGDSCLFLHNSLVEADSTVIKYPEISSCHNSFFLENSIDINAKVDNVITVPTYRFFVNYGRCERGDSCRYLHTESCIILNDKMANENVNAKFAKFCNDGFPSSDQLEAAANIPVCRYFFSKGKCQRGEHCLYSHDANHSINVNEKVSDSNNVDRVTDSIKNLFNESDFISGFHQFEIIPDVMSCKLGPGAEVVELLLPSKRSVSRVWINGLTVKINDADLLRTLNSFGQIKSIKRGHITYAFVEYFNGAEAETAVAALNGQLLKDIWRAESKNKLDVLSVRLAAEQGAVITQHSSFKVTWYKITQLAWANFNRQIEAETTAKKCNGKNINGSKLSMKFQTPSRGQRTAFTVIITDIPRNVTTHDIEKLIDGVCHLKPSSITFQQGNVNHDKLASKRNISDDKILRNMFEVYGPISLFDHSSATTETGKCKAFMKFVNSADADACLLGLGNKFKCEKLGTDVFLERVYTAKFSVLNPIFECLTNEVNEVLRNCTSDIRHRFFPSVKQMVIRITGDGPKSVASVKSKLQRIFTGEKLQTPPSADGHHAKQLTYWHELLQTSDAVAFVKESIAIGCGCYIVLNLRRHEVVLYGSVDARGRAAMAIFDYIETLSKQSYSITIDPLLWKPLLSIGLQAVKEISNASHISLNISQKSIVIHGTNQIVSKKIILSYIQNLTKPNQKNDEQFAVNIKSHNTTNIESNNDEDSSMNLECPVCLCFANEEGPENMIRLNCSHCYCKSCFDMWISQSLSGDASCGKSFPLKCCAVDCSKPIEITDLKKVLSSQTFSLVIRATVDEYVINNLQKYQFCFTADCDNIHIKGSDERLINCSLCQLSLCTRCKCEEHEGITCEENQYEKAPPDEHRIRILETILTLKCPRCDKAFLDFEGCFALKCGSCPCAFCGWCLADCGTDAHPHVLQCKLNPTKPPQYFSTKAEFDKAMRSRAISKLKQYLGGLGEELRAQIIKNIDVDLRDLGINVDSISCK
eukprot:gene7628-10385_t